MADDGLWIYEYEWNCIPARSDFRVMRGYGKEAVDLIEFSEFDHGYDKAKQLAEQYIEELRGGRIESH